MGKIIIGKINLLPIITRQAVRTKSILKPPSCRAPASTSSPQAAQGEKGMEAVVSPGCFVSATPSSLTWVAAGFVLSWLLTPLSQLRQCSVFLALRRGQKTHSPRNPTKVVHGLALASGGSLVKPAGAGSELTWGSCWAMLTEGAPAAPPQQNLAA